MQVVGMIMLPLAMAGNLAPGSHQTVGQMMWLTAVGIAVFAAGYVIQQYARPRA
jgi:hypothetical protein